MSNHNHECAAKTMQAPVGLRDHFAGQALAGYMIWYWYEYPKTIRPDEIYDTVVAENCYRLADEMMRVRSRKQPNPSV